VGKNNTFIQTETNNFVLKCWNEADEINLLFNLEVEADKENITKTQKKAELENKKAEELAAALAPDKEKVIKFTADILNNIAEYQITIKDEDIKKLLIKSITILTDELNYLKAVVDK
jgi:type II secretory pathway component PulL